MTDQVPLIPKVPGGPLRVLMIGRISTPHQDLESIDAGHRDVSRFLDRIYQGPLHVKQLGGRGSGMRTDRDSIVEAEEEIATGTWDLVIAPDLGRFYRNPRHLYVFVQDAVDQDTRVITEADDFDTADASWHLKMGIAAIQHGMVIPDTQRRVRSKARDQFHKGRMVQKIRYGYRKLTAEEAAAGPGPAGLLLARKPECTAYILEMRRRVLDDQPYTEVAAWLIDEEVEPGPYVKGPWTGRLVADLLRDPILSGTRTFGDWLSTTIFKTGKKRRRKNPETPEVEHYPELAHMTPAEQAELVAFMDMRAGPNRDAVGPEHPLYNKPRDRAFWPAQHPRCGASGETMYRYEAEDLKCRGTFVAKKSDGTGPGPGPRCWNHLQVDCREIRARVLAWVLAHCDGVPDFREALVDAAWSELEAEAKRAGRSGRSDEEEIVELVRRSRLLAKAIARGGELEALLEELGEINGQLEAARARVAARQAVASGPRLGSRGEVAEGLEAALSLLAATSYDFAALMRRVIPVFTIVPVQALDSGLVRARGKLVLRLAALLEDGKGPAAEGDVTAPREGDVALTIDLFEPPSHIRAIGTCREARRLNPRLSLDKITKETGIHRMTVKRALAYARLMEAEGLADPYRELRSRPDSASRWWHRDAS
jgi:site-specific DNA recombinase